MRSSVDIAGLVVTCCILVSIAGSAAVEERPAGIVRLPKPENWCITQRTPIDCDLRDDCVWCEKPGTKLATRCYPVKAAKLVPKSWGLACDKDLDPPAAAAAATAAVNADQSGQAGASCDGRPEASCMAPDCVWCTSAAVGGGCYTPDEARLLPRAIFKCKMPTAVAAQ